MSAIPRHRVASCTVLETFFPTSILISHIRCLRIGRLIGGWKANALRHSFISYRAAQVGLGKTAMEAGNSEGEAKRSYNSAMSEVEANLYFSIFRPGFQEQVRTQGRKR